MATATTTLVLERDATSLSNPQEALVKHLDWNILVDFDRCVVSGTATYEVQYDCTAIKKQLLCLDTAHLDIRSIVHADTGNVLEYQLQDWIPHQHHLGRKLEIVLPHDVTTTTTTSTNSTIIQVAITYSTTLSSSALQWLPPAQTSGKQHPYLFTQCQAIHARTLVPCQDTPSVKFTYTARVTVPSWATAVVSAVLLQEEDMTKTAAIGSSSSTTTTTPPPATRTFLFHQKVPIPSYLLAMAVGDLVRYDVSDRCAIWTEPSLVEAAAYEFAQTEDFLQIAEDIAGMPYVWDRYDLLLLPPSFPYGGMENPCLTFVTPTLLAGDRSLADVVAHEISHSWTGNLVTNVTWDHFWLNEGWTTWFQRAIMNRIHDNDKFSDMDAISGYKDLQDAVTRLPVDCTRLVLPIGNQDPDEYYSIVAYEKGFNLLYALEQRVGTTAFYAFFQAYLKEFAYKTLDSNDFLTFCQTYFKTMDDTKEALQDFDWDTWYHQPGMPPEVPQFDRTLTQEAEDLARRWVMLDRQQSTAAALDRSSLKPQQPWSSEQTTCFLDTIETLTTTKEGGGPLQVSTLSLLNEQFGFLDTKNAEILFRYCKLAVAAEDETCLPAVVSFITSQGRMKYVRPLYRALAQSKMGRHVAVTAFVQHRDSYHPICAKMIALDMKVDEDNSDTTLKKSTTSDAVVSGIQKHYWRLTVGVVILSVGLVALRRYRR